VLDGGWDAWTRAEVREHERGIDGERAT
jgi:hypothetical protein